MIAHFNIIQGSDEWHRIRHGKIGGTLSKCLLVESDTLLTELLSAQLEPFEHEEIYVSPEMERGSELEPEARKRLMAYTGIEFIECGWLESEENKLLGHSPDGITQDFKIMCEIKCPGRKKHTSTLMEKQIPFDNIHQCLHAFVVNPKLESLFFLSFRPESKHPMFVKELQRSSVVTLGTKAKPISKSVNDWAIDMLKEANELEIEINQQKEKLEF